MSVLDIIIILAVLLLFFLAWRRTRKKPSCCGSCSGCVHAGNCGQKRGEG